MKLKNYLLIEGRAVKVGADMKRVFPNLAGKRAPWVSIVHQDEVQSLADIVRVYLTYAYYDLDGKLDLTQQHKEAAQILNDCFSASLLKKMMNLKTCFQCPTELKYLNSQQMNENFSR